MKKLLILVLVAVVLMSATVGFAGQRFKYSDKVEVLSGFYAGHQGYVIYEMEVRRKCQFKYQVVFTSGILRDNERWFDINEIKLIEEEE